MLTVQDSHQTDEWQTQQPPNLTFTGGNSHTSTPSAPLIITLNQKTTLNRFLLRSWISSKNYYPFINTCKSFLRSNSPPILCNDVSTAKYMQDEKKVHSLNANLKNECTVSEVWGWLLLKLIPIKQIRFKKKKVRIWKICSSWPPHRTFNKRHDSSIPNFMVLSGILCLIKEECFLKFFSSLCKLISRVHINTCEVCLSASELHHGALRNLFFVRAIETITGTKLKQCHIRSNFLNCTLILWPGNRWALVEAFSIRLWKKKNPFFSRALNNGIQNHGILCAHTNASLLPEY